jgi:hypothetical protein
VRLSPLGTAATTGILYQLQMIDGDCETIDGMNFGREIRNTRRKSAPAPLCPADPGSNPVRRGEKPETNLLSAALILRHIYLTISDLFLIIFRAM